MAIDPPTASTLRRGAHLGQYQLLVSVATGGMGEVWAARQIGVRGFRKIVAIKVAHAALAGPKFERMFLDEARLASAIHHPNVCSILELGESNGLLYLVMEWIGDSVNDLAEALPEHRLAPRKAAWLVSQACAGLHAAHELCDENGTSLQVIHRDVSPHNLLLMPSGHVKITDFGIAQASNQAHEATATGTVKGKISYMAPERFTQANCDRRVDIFAAGCVLYELALGRKPYPASGIEAIYRIVEGAFDHPTTLEPEFPKELEGIILRSMAREPADRYQTADEMRSALVQYIASSGPHCSENDIASVANHILAERMARRAKAIRDAAAALDESESAERMLGVLPLASAASDAVGTDSTAAVVSEAPKAPPNRQVSLRVAGFAALTLAAAALGTFMGVRPTPNASTVPARASNAWANGAATQAPSLIAQATLAPSSVAAEVVEIMLQAEPAGATFSIDNGPPLPNPHRIATSRDMAVHVLRVVAANHEESMQSVVFDRNQQINIQLRMRGTQPLRGGHPAPMGAGLVASKPQGAGTAATAKAASTPAPDPADTSQRHRPKRTLDPTDPFKE
jgi:eukaryotic-like serine/threonine-protein kinase